MLISSKLKSVWLASSKPNVANTSRQVTSRKQQIKTPKKFFSSDEVEKKLQEQGLTWPGAVNPKANYLGVVRTGSLLFLSGHLPYDPPHHTDAQNLIKGKLGKDVSIEKGQLAAKYCAVALLGSLKDNINSWEHVKRIVKVTGYVNCVDGYEPISSVMDGASDLFVNVLGKQKGLHARAAIGVASLPYNAAVEVEMVVELDDQFA